MTEPTHLLPELGEWDQGRGIPVHDWLQTFIRSDHAIAYAQLFWPSFVEHESYILRDDFSVASLREWEREPGTARWQVEAIVNTLYLDDALFSNETWSQLVEQRAVHVGRILAQIYTAKLALDFPTRTFVVEFWDGSRPGNDQISLSFWQQP